MTDKRTAWERVGERLGVSPLSMLSPQATPARRGGAQALPLAVLGPRFTEFPGRGRNGLPSRRAQTHSLAAAVRLSHGGVTCEETTRTRRALFRRGLAVTPTPAPGMTPTTSNVNCLYSRSGARWRRSRLCSDSLLRTNRRSCRSLRFDANAIPRRRPDRTPTCPEPCRVSSIVALVAPTIRREGTSPIVPIRIDAVNTGIPGT